MIKSTSTSLILLGVLAVVIGVIAIAWPGVTILALVIMFAVYAFMDAGLQAARAFSSRNAGPVLGHLLLGLVDVVALKVCPGMARAHRVRPGHPRGVLGAGRRLRRDLRRFRHR